jgi:ABC-type phosphate/phosphonate transport system substrate-binding protein
MRFHDPPPSALIALWPRRRLAGRLSGSEVRHPVGREREDRLMRNEPLRAYLEDKLGVEVEIFTAGNYDGVIQAIAADQIEIARFGSSSYAAAYTATDGGVVPTLTTLKKDGSTGYYLDRA